jgi:hypothetical protein
MHPAFLFGYILHKPDGSVLLTFLLYNEKDMFNNLLFRSICTSFIPINILNY